MLFVNEAQFQETQRVIAEGVAQTRATQPKRRPSVDDLPQMENELRTLRERLSLHEDIVRECSSEINALKSGLTPLETAYEKLQKRVENAVVPGAAVTLADLRLKIERKLDRLTEMTDRRDRSKKIVFGTKKLIDEFDVKTLNELRELDREFA